MMTHPLRIHSFNEQPASLYGAYARVILTSSRLWNESTYIERNFVK